MMEYSPAGFDVNGDTQQDDCKVAFHHPNSTVTPQSPCQSRIHLPTIITVTLKPNPPPRRQVSNAHKPPRPIRNSHPISASGPEREKMAGNVREWPGNRKIPQ